MKFPNRTYTSVSDYLDGYKQEYTRAMESVDASLLQVVVDLFEKTYIQGSKAIVCGNGGSASIANHMVGDHGKIIQTDTNITARVISLCSNTEIMTAVANDISYDQIFSYPLRSLGSPGDVLLTISGSGESKNIINAILVAKELNMKVVCFTGFSGGKSAQLADINLHVNSENYGVVEDIHQALMQIISQYVRMKNMDPLLIPERFF